MKTLEEKAKAYDEAFERAKDYYKANQKIGESDENEVLSDIFPELAESEDEKIKNAIITTIHLYYGEPLEDEAKEMIAWLEKQSKSMWTDEDEERLQSCIIKLQGKGLMGGVDTMDSKWLKSLKQRIEEQ